MRMLHKLVEFKIPRQDLTTIYILYIRSVLEQSCQVWQWHISLSFENLTDLVSYEHALETVDLECLVESRDKLCLKFAKACLKNENVKSMFPLNDIPYHVDDEWGDPTSKTWLGISAICTQISHLVLTPL